MNSTETPLRNIFDATIGELYQDSSPIDRQLMFYGFMAGAATVLETMLAISRTDGDPKLAAEVIKRFHSEVMDYNGSLTEDHNRRN